MKFLRMRPGFGEQLIAEGDVEVAEEEQALIEEFRRQLDQGMWAAVPTTRSDGRREAEMVRAFDDIPRDTGRVIFFPRAAGGAAVTCSSRSRPPRSSSSPCCGRSRCRGSTGAWRRRRARRERRRAGEPGAAYDPGRERRAEQRARELLKSCVNEEEWAMYRDLGFLRVWGGQSDPDGPSELRGVDYAYLIYPHKPIVAYLPQTGRLLNEYCVEFPDETRPYGSPRLPDSDDVLAKWMALQGDERRIIAEANLHLPGRQIDPRQIQRDLWRLGRWERERLARAMRAGAAAARRARGRISSGRHGRRQDSIPSTSPASSPRGPARAAARSYLHGIGFDAEALAKPIIGVASTWTETMPCNFGLRALAAKVKEGIRAAGGTPMEFNTIAISDGITMGTSGMKTSLVSREVVADSIELVARGHLFDGIVALAACDKTIPGAAMALARLERPRRAALRRLDPARPLQGPRTSRSSRSSRRSARTPPGKIDDAELRELEEAASPGRRRLRRPVHREHDGDGVRGARPLADGLGDGPRRLRGQEPRRRRRRAR